MRKVIRLVTLALLSCAGAVLLGSSCAAAASDIALLLERAQRLETAAAGCRDKVSSGELRDCSVKIDWQDRLVSPAAAEALARDLRTQARSLYSQQIEQQNDESNRSAYDYAKIINGFQVQTNPHYAVATNGDTYCNIFAQDLTAAMGAPLPRVRANEIYDWLNDKTKGGAHGWRKVSDDEAQQMSNNGHPTVAIWSNPHGIHGHIAVVRPGSVGDARGVAEAQSGNLVLNATHLKTGFNDPLFKKSVTYWIHN